MSKYLLSKSLALKLVTESMVEWFLRKLNLNFLGPVDVTNDECQLKCIFFTVQPTISLIGFKFIKFFNLRDYITVSSLADPPPLPPP